MPESRGADLRRYESPDKPFAAYPGAALAGVRGGWASLVRQRVAPVVQVPAAGVWCPSGRSCSAVLGPPSWEYAKDDDHALLVIEGEAHASVSDTESPFDGVQSADVAGVGVCDKPVEGAGDPALDGRVKAA